MAERIENTAPVKLYTNYIYTPSVLIEQSYPRHDELVGVLSEWMERDGDGFVVTDLVLKREYRRGAISDQFNLEQIEANRTAVSEIFSILSRFDTDMVIAHVPDTGFTFTDVVKHLHQLPAVWTGPMVFELRGDNGYVRFTLEDGQQDVRDAIVAVKA